MNKIISKLLITLGTLVAVTLLGVPQAQAQTELSRLRTSEYVAKDINGKEHNIDAILKYTSLVFWRGSMRCLVPMEPIRLRSSG